VQARLDGRKCKSHLLPLLFQPRHPACTRCGTAALEAAAALRYLQPLQLLGFEKIEGAVLAHRPADDRSPEESVWGSKGTEKSVALAVKL
jgi:hypothetical protein